MNTWKRVGAMLLTAAVAAGSYTGAFAAEPMEQEAAQTETAYTQTQQRVITGFADAGVMLDEISFYYGQPEEELTAQMPAEISVYLDGDVFAQSIPVSWVCLGDYAESDDFYYQFCPQWDIESYPLAEGLDVLRDAPFVFAVRTATVQNGNIMSAQYRSASDNERIIYSFLRKEFGFNTAVACGILANVEAESDFNPYLYDAGGRTYGVLQWTDSRLETLRTWCDENGYDWRELDGQLQYLKKELSANDNRYLWNGKTIYNKMLTFTNDAQGAYDAGYYWCYEYERPANKEVRSVTRGNQAKLTFWPMYENSEPMDEQASAPSKPPVSDGDSSSSGSASNDSTSGNPSDSANKSAVDTFRDVKSTSWFCSAANFVYANNLMVGMSETEFSPNTKLNRAMGAAILQRMTALADGRFVLEEGEPDSFRDVSQKSWYAKGINWATSVGIMKGMSATQFAPMEDLTREQLVYVLYVYSDKLGIDVSKSSSLKGFSDTSKISGYAKNAVKWAVAEGILSGSGGKLNPKNSITRAEAAALYERFYNYVVER